MTKAQTIKRPMTKGKKAAVIISSILLAIILIVLIVFSGYMIALADEIKVMKTLKEIDNYPLYTMDYKSADYDLDAAIDYGIDSENKLVEYITKTLLGFPIKIDLEKFLASPACTSFNAETPEGDAIFARNFDYEYTPILVLKSSPKKGYKSVSTCDLAMVGYAEDFLPDNFFAKFLTLVTVYMPMDGMNEKGLGISVLELPNKPVHQDNGKPDITTSLMIRMVLDRAANVNEAINIFNSYDMHENDAIGSSYHFFITDASGDTALIEYVGENGNDLNVIRNSEENKNIMVANQYLSEGYTHIGDFEIGKSQERLDSITKSVTDANGILTEAAAMDALKKAVMKDIYYPDIDFMTNTQWSIVYNLDALTMKLCVNMNYDKVYNFAIDF